MKKYLLLLTMFLWVGLEGFSQSEKEELITDRPDQTESAYTVPKSSFQLESGLVYEKYNEFFENTIQGNLLRYGLVKGVELRLGFGYQCEKFSLEGGDLKNKGWSSLEAGAKVVVLQGEEFLPRLALLGGITFPHTGSSVFENEDWAGFIRLAGEWELSSDASLGFNLGPEFSEGSFSSPWFYSLVYGYSLNHQWAFFGESFGLIGKDQSPQHFLDAGFTFLVTPTFQLDASTGVGISNAAADFFLSMGFSWRIPQ